MGPDDAIGAKDGGEDRRLPPEHIRTCQHDTAINPRHETKRHGQKRLLHVSVFLQKLDCKVAEQPEAGRKLV
eukprot:5936166-Prymnesium_polylepis.2